MASEHEAFWGHESYAVVGHSERKPFPKLSYTALKRGGRRVFAVDPSVDEIEGDVAYSDIASLPERVDALVLEVPRDETAGWMQQAADAGIEHVWIHMNRETDEALELAKARGINVLTGTCAVMYVTGGLSYHSIHKWINQLAGKY